MAKVRITEPAETEIRAAFAWWRDHRSAEQATRWYREIRQAIASLSKSAERCPLAPETDLLSQGIRQLLIGLGRRPTHRIVFTISKTEVTILRVRHAA
jgi:plasmid stabilization system protein ParE